MCQVCCQYDTFTSMQWIKVDDLPSGIDALLDLSWMNEYHQYVERYTQTNEVHDLIPAWNEKKTPNDHLVVHFGFHVFGSVITWLSSGICQQTCGLPF